MNILIAGGTGLIGHHLREQLIDNKHQITIITRQDKSAQTPPSYKPLTYIQWIQKDIDRVMESTDIVINLSGASIFSKRWTRSFKDFLYSSRLKPLNQLKDAIKKSPHKKRLFIQASASGYYGSYSFQKKDQPFLESNPPGSDFLAQLANIWETSLKSIDTTNTKIIKLRLGIVLAKDGGAFPKLALPFKLFAGGTFGFGNQPFSWIHIDDVCQAILYLIKDPKPGAYNLSAPDFVTNKELAQGLGHHLNRPAFIPIPAPFLTLLLGERSILLLKGQYQSSNKLIQSGYTFKYPTLTKALKDLTTK